MTNIWLIGYKVSLLGLLLFSLYFGTPVLGVMTFKSFIIDTLGCPDFFHFSTPDPCFIFGYDIAPRFGLYRVPVANIFITPIAYLVVFFELIAFWVFVIIFLKYMSWSKNRKIVNKVKNESASEAGEDAAKTRRPFERR